MFDDQAQGPNTAVHNSHRVVRVHLDRHRHQLLAELAADSGVRSEQLAAIWLRDRLDQIASTMLLARAADEMREMRELIGGHSDGPSRRGPRAGRRRESLHNEIVTVLEQRGQPMTAAEIAAAIRQRGHYKSPRSANPISGAAVSRRIANPYYRSLFERRGRHVRLAADVDR
jgi:hypothetical protein